MSIVLDVGTIAMGFMVSVGDKDVVNSYYITRRNVITKEQV